MGVCARHVRRRHSTRRRVKEDTGAGELYGRDHLAGAALQMPAAQRADRFIDAALPRFSRLGVLNGEHNAPLVAV